MKSPALVAVPAGVVTPTFPVLAPAGTVAVILTAELTIWLAAAVPWNVTAVAPVEFAPWMATLAPAPPCAGVKLVIRGATVKLAALVAVPAGVVTAIGPVVALPGTVIMVCVPPELTVKAAASPLSLTEVAPVNAVPVIVTLAPTTPLPGLKLAIVGLTVKLPALVAVPAGVVTAIFPVVAPAGTVAVILIGVLTVNGVAAVPLNVTADAPVKLAPLIVTLV